MSSGSSADDDVGLSHDGARGEDAVLGLNRELVVERSAIFFSVLVDVMGRTQQIGMIEVVNVLLKGVVFTGRMDGVEYAHDILSM